MLVDVMHCIQLTDALVVEGIHRQHRAGYRCERDVKIDRQFRRTGGVHEQVIHDQLQGESEKQGEARVRGLPET